jgi:hypothetical protein
MPRAGFESAIPMFERPKTVRTLDLAAIGTGGQVVNQTYYVEILKWVREAVLGKGLNFGPMIRFSIMTMFQLCQAVSCPKTDY